MKEVSTPAIPAVVFAVLLVTFLACLASSSAQLPDRVATRFGPGGQPVNWTDRAAAVRATAGFGVGVPLLLIALSFAMRSLPDELWNIPHREYWLAPERRNQTFAFVSRQLLWLACLVLCLMGGVYWLILQANLSTPVHMPTALLGAILGSFLAGMAVWTVHFVRRFYRPKRLPLTGETPP